MKSLNIFFFAIAMLFLSCKKESNKPTPKQCINNIIKQDDSFGTIRNHASKTISLSKTIKQYTFSLEQLDFSNCPEEFSKAFKTHIKAWKDMINITDNHDSIRGEMHDLFDKIEASKDSTLFKQKLKAIWDTWGAIEKNLKPIS